MGGIFNKKNGQLKKKNIFLVIFWVEFDGGDAKNICQLNDRYSLSINPNLNLKFFA